MGPVADPSHLIRDSLTHGVLSEDDLAWSCIQGGQRPPSRENAESRGTAGLRDPFLERPLLIDNFKLKQTGSPGGPVR